MNSSDIFDEFIINKYIYLGGKQVSNVGIFSGGIDFGNSTMNCTIKRPFSNGFL